MPKKKRIVRKKPKTDDNFEDYLRNEGKKSLHRVTDAGRNLEAMRAKKGTHDPVQVKPKSTKIRMTRRVPGVPKGGE